jgi:hypothetical protein
MKLLKSIIMITVSMRSVVSFVPSNIVKATKEHMQHGKFTSITSSSSSISNTKSQHNLFNQLFSTSTATSNNNKYPILADESIMSPKKHGTSDEPVQKDLRWKCDYETADRIW